MSYNTPVRLLPQGSTQEVAASGTLLVSSGGSIQIESGGAFSNAGAQSIASGGQIAVASGGSISVSSGGSIQIAAGGILHTAGTINLGGTAGRWAFGTVSLASGVGTFATGLGTVASVTGNAIGADIGNGTFTGVQVDLSLATAGSVIFRALSGSLAFSAGGTASWIAMGW